MASRGICDRVAIVGMGCTAFGEHWESIRGVWRGFDGVVLAALLVLFLLWLRSHLKSR